MRSQGEEVRTKQVHAAEPSFCQVHAVKALQALVAANINSSEVIAKSGEPTALVELLKSGSSAAKEYAVWSLSISISDENQGQGWRVALGLGL